MSEWPIRPEPPRHTRAWAVFPRLAQRCVSISASGMARSKSLRDRRLPTPGVMRQPAFTISLAFQEFCASISPRFRLRPKTSTYAALGPCFDPRSVFCWRRYRLRFPATLAAHSPALHRIEPNPKVSPVFRFRFWRARMESISSRQRRRSRRRWKCLTRTRRRLIAPDQPD